MIFANIYLVFAVFILIKNVNAYCNGIKIINGIYLYIEDCHMNNKIVPAVHYDDMEGHVKTLFRLWDWSYKRILPKEKFEIIKPYIK